MAEYTADDIYVLYKMINKPVLKENVNRRVTKGEFKLYLDSRGINIKTSISRLLKAGLIRENTPKEFLKHLTTSDLKKLLNRQGSLTKDLLVEEAKATLSDEEVRNHRKYMTIYMVSDLASDTLKKYENLIFYFEKVDDIFGYGERNVRFNASYFFKNPALNPLDVIFEYYKNKNPEIAGRVCYLREEYDSAIFYGIKLNTKKLSVNIENIIERSYYEYSFKLEQVKIFDRWFTGAYGRIESSEDNVKEWIRQEYKQTFKYTELISYDLFERAHFAILYEESEEIVRISLEIDKLIKDKYFSKQDEQESKDAIDGIRRVEEYYEQTAKDLALLDLLIGHLDLELLYGLRERVDLRISERKKTLDVDEQTFFEER
ncbi:hypothetical protein ABE945_07630 [Enterococcus gilvus]|uniref:hypothetical protein n=1 Tax=Enterococcus gilvus TaxID=160453 RepID=UPI003D6AF8F3